MKKINVAELLKDCPTGMELDSTMFEKVTFVRVQMDRQFPIEIAVNGIRSKYLTKEGCFHDRTLLPEAKCIIFPKGKTTWEGFTPPFKFKIGDKVRHKNNHGVVFTITDIKEDTYVCGAAKAFWLDDQDKYELVPNKFDIHTLKPLQPVLVRNTNGQVWTMNFFSHIIDTNKGLQPSIVCVTHSPNQCIPYKGNEFLRGTSDDCKDFYKTWES